MNVNTKLFNQMNHAQLTRWATDFVAAIALADGCSIGFESKDVCPTNSDNDSAHIVWQLFKTGQTKPIGIIFQFFDNEIVFEPCLIVDAGAMINLPFSFPSIELAIDCILSAKVKQI